MAQADSAQFERTGQSQIPVLRIELLGGFRAGVGSATVQDAAWQRKSAKRLIKMLALEPTHLLHREQIIERLWPFVPPASARISLRQALHLARRTLEPLIERDGLSTYVSVSDDMVGLVTDNVRIDVDRFENLAARALAGCSAHDHREAILAYGGSLLPEDLYEEWTVVARDRLTERFLALLLGEAGCLEQAGRLDESAECLRLALIHDPLREDAHRRLMSVYTAAGRRHDALRQYHACVRLLDAGLEMAPDRVTQALYQSIVAGTPGSPAARRTVVPAVVRNASTAPVVGRKWALETVTRLLTSAERGTGAFVLVGGEAGVGKSRLAVELARRAHERDCLVLWGTGFEQEAQLPYGPFVEAMDSYLVDRPLDERQSLAAAFPELARLIPSVAREYPRTRSSASPESGFESLPGTRDSERGRLFAAMAGLLVQLCSDRPLVLVIDDLHNADSASLHVLRHLARGASGRRWLIVATYRDEDIAAGGEFQLLRTSATREGWCHRIDLLRLARADADVMARALLAPEKAEPALLETLYNLSLGNPLFLEELIATVHEHGAAALESDRWANGMLVPRHVKDLVEARMRSLDRGAITALSLAAAVGRDFQFSLLREAGRLLEPLLPETTVLDGLDRALTMHLVEEGAGDYSFRHPLLRAAIYDRLSGPRRITLHAALGSALEASFDAGEQDPPERADLLAYHLGRSDDSAKAVKYFEIAGDRARALYANVAAGESYSAALQRRPAPIAAARLLEKLGSLLRTMARYDRAVATLQEAAALYRRMEDRSGEVRAAVEIGRIQALRGHPDRGIGVIEPLMDSLRLQAGRVDLARALAALAHLYFAAGQYSRSLNTAREAAQLAQESNDLIVLAEAQQWHGTALCMAGKVDEGIEVLENAIRLAEQVGDLTNLSRGLNNAAEIYELGGRFEKSRIYIERALSVAHRQGDPARVAFMTTRRGDDAYLTGDWKRARVYYDEAQAIIDEIGSSWFRAYLLSSSGRLELGRGNVKLANEHLEQAVNLSLASGDPQAMRSAQASLAEIDLMFDRSSVARDRLEPLLYNPSLEEEEVTFLLPILAEAHLRSGTLERSEQLLRKAIQQADREQDKVSLVETHRIWTLLAAQQSQPERADVEAEAALALARALRSPYLLVKVLLSVAELRVWSKRSTEGEPLLMEAADLSAELGAQYHREKCLRLLREVGSPPVGGSESGGPGTVL